MLQYKTHVVFTSHHAQIIYFAAQTSPLISERKALYAIVCAAQINDGRTFVWFQEEIKHVVLILVCVHALDSDTGNKHLSMIVLSAYRASAKWNTDGRIQLLLIFGLRYFRKDTCVGQCGRKRCPRARKISASSSVLWNVIGDMLVVIAQWEHDLREHRFARMVALTCARTIVRKLKELFALTRRQEYVKRST